MTAQFFCPNCAKPVLADADACGHCGALFTEGAAWAPVDAAGEPVRALPRPVVSRPEDPTSRAGLLQLLMSRGRTVCHRLRASAPPTLYGIRAALVATLVAALAVAWLINRWPGVFEFSKVMHLPDWAKDLGVGIRLPRYLLGICLAVPILAWPSLRGAAAASFAALISGVALGLLLKRDGAAHLSVFANFVWIVLFYGTPPLLALLSFRFALGKAVRTVLRLTRRVRG